MPKKIGNVERSVLTSAALPQATNTYTVISHSYVINTIMQALDTNGFTVKDEVYRCTTDAKVAHGAFIINYENDPDLELMYSFSNSYDKSLRFRAAVGAYVPANEGFIISEMDNWRRKHTGTADNETEELINEHIENARDYFDQLKRDKEAMKNIQIDKQTFGSIIGQLFINGYLGIDQLSLVAKEYDSPSFAYATGQDNLWTCYCHIIGALRQSHPSKWMQNQVAVHLFFVAKYNLSQFDDEETTDEYGTPDTLQSQEPEEASNESIIPGILDGVEEVTVLPGFEPAATSTPVEQEEPEEDYVDPNQLDLVEQSEELAEAMVAPFKSEDPLPLTELNAEELPQKEEPVEANWNLSEEVQDVIPEMMDEARPEEPVKETGAEVHSGTAGTEKPDDTDEHYFFQSDYPGLQVGDCFEATEGEGDYYEIQGTMESEEGELYVCSVVDTEEFTEEPVEEAEEVNAEEKEELLVDVIDDSATTEEFSIADEPDISLEEEPAAEAEEEEEDIPQVPGPEDVGTDIHQDPKIMEAIGNELEEIYGYKPVFTYEEKGNQYNIVLDSGESVVLSTAYINSMV